MRQTSSRSRLSESAFANWMARLRGRGSIWNDDLRATWRLTIAWSSRAVKGRPHHGRAALCFADTAVASRAVGRSNSTLGRMHALSHLWLLPLGFIAGLLAVPLLMRWVLLLLGTIGKLPPQLGSASQRPRTVGIRLAIAHPVPWLLLLGLAFGIPRIVASPSRAAWLWFLAGAVAAPAINAALVYASIRRARRNRAGGGSS